MNRGAAHVRAQMKARGLTQNEAARLVTCDSGNFSRILNDDRGPGRALAGRIWAQFGTEVQWWDEKISDEEAAGMLAAVEPPPESSPTPAANESGEHPAVTATGTDEGGR